MSASPTPILVVVDMQRDFMEEGALPTVEPSSIVTGLNVAMAAARGRGFTIVATRDWHPVDHESFQKNGGIWPDHCVAGTPGAEFHPGLRFPEGVVVVSKGSERAGLGYSPFENAAMVDLVRRQAGATVYVTGVALEYCVRATCLDALKYGGRPVAVMPLIRSVSRDAKVLQEVEAELTEAGVVCVPQVPPELA
ncbi:MAG TPA: isochorismatase family protein [Thermoanaerobaculia bacterium]|jgi:nicotinamidase/pyrazinamidase|nr:isochorismatase family protein [Thermoanaerobaculia bacterium]